MNELLHLLTEPLQEGLKNQILERFRALQLEDPFRDVFDLLRDTLQDFPELERYPQGWPPGWWLEPNLSRWWLCLSVDWKASEEVAWQIQAISRTLELTGGYSNLSGEPVLEQTQVLDALKHASHWLRWRDCHLVLLESGGDDYMAVIVPHPRLEAVRDAFKRLGVNSSLV